MENLILYTILFIIVSNFLFEQWLEYINLKNLKPLLPESLSNIYDQQSYEKSIAYEKINAQFGLLTSSISFVAIILMILLQGFNFIHQTALLFNLNSVWTSLIFFGILMFASDILSIPFAIYKVFVIEEKFGFNKTTIKTFIFDKLKNWLLMIILGGTLLGFIIYIYVKTGQNFWLYVWIFLTCFSIFMTLFYSNLIVPIFNKQTPLQDGSLRTAINSLAQKAGFKLNNIFIINGSKRSTKANAYFTGFGPKKRIVLYDTLINDLSENEIVAVLAHEIGHYKKKHVQQGLLYSTLHTGALLFIFSFFLSNPIFSKVLGADQSYFHLNIIVIGILYSPISMLLSLVMNKISRVNEYQADQFVVNFGLADDLVSALKKLSVKNLSNLTPHPFYVFIYYSHPTLLQRISQLQKK